MLDESILLGDEFCALAFLGAILYVIGIVALTNKKVNSIINDLRKEKDDEV